MADYNSSLPVRSEADGTDERLHSKIVDGANPSQMATVDADLNLHVEMHGNDPAGVDRVVRLSELGALTPDGVYDVANNTKPGNLGLIASSRAAAPDDTTQTQRITSVIDTGGTVRALDVSMHDEDGNPFSNTNPLPVTLTDPPGAKINDYATSAAVAAAASVNHDYTVTAAETLELSHIYASGSGMIKCEVKVETAAASNVFVTKFVGFNSTANSQIDFWINEAIEVATGVRVRLTITNRDKQPQDVYSTISGHEIP
jgi:hypothetical protein